MTNKQNLATKKDVKILRSDVKELKGNVKGLKSDVKRLGEAVKGNTKAIEVNGKDILGFKWEVDKRFIALQERMEKMFTDLKDYIFNLIDPTMKELETMRQEQIVISHQTTEHEEKLEDHEKRITHLEAS